MTRSGVVLARRIAAIFLMLSVGLAGCSEEDNKSSNEEQTPSSSGGLTSIQERVASGVPGELIVIEETEFVGTLRIPAGVSISGVEGSELIIRPEPGEPGIEMLGKGASMVSHVRVEDAGGVGIQIEERDVILTNVVVEGTKASETLQGHGIHVQNAPAFEAHRVSSNNNEGSGVTVEGTENVVIVHPQFLPIPTEVIGNASAVIVHPQFVTGTETEVIVHPQFQPEDEEEIVIVHPQFMDEDEYAIIVHPQFFEGSTFNGNGQDGISIVHPQFTTAGTTVFSTANLVGISSTGNGANGLALQGVQGASLQSSVITQNGGENGSSTSNGLMLTDSSVTTNGIYVAENEGAGAKLTNSSISVGGNTTIQAARNGVDASENISIVHPQFLPMATFANNQGGVLVTQDNLARTQAGKADNPWGDMLVLNGALIEGNALFGVKSACTPVQLKNTHVTGTTSNQTGFFGEGVLIGGFGQCNENVPSLDIDAGSIVSENEGSGVVLREGAQGVIRGIVHGNQKGGIVASSANTMLSLQPLEKVEPGVICEALNCAPPLIQDNHIAGIAVAEGASLFMDEVFVNGTKDGQVPWAAAQKAEISFGDGVMAIRPASLTIKNSTLSGNARSGLLLVDDESASGVGGTGGTSIVNSVFENAVYGAMRIAPDVDNATVMTPEALASLEQPAYWGGMINSCTAVGNLHEWVAYGCLPYPSFACDLGDGSCSVSTPCGECWKQCKEDPYSCNLTACNCPSDAQCCNNQDCLPLDRLPNDCEVAVCTEDWTCDVQTLQTSECDESVVSDVGGGNEPPETCETDIECESLSVGCAVGQCIDNVCEETYEDNLCDDGLDCTVDICVSEGFCESSLKIEHCLLTNSQGAEFCVAEGAAMPGDPCSFCVPIQSQTDWTPLAFGPCDDLDPCTINDVCSAEGCSGSAKVCPDEGPCVTTQCQAGTGDCISSPVVEASFCEDGDACTVYDACENGVCVGGVNPCDDQNPCTINDCTPDEDDNRYTCTHQTLPKGTACDDGDSCTVSSMCSEVGECQATEYVECSGDPTDSCSEYSCFDGQCQIVSISECCEDDADCDDGNDDNKSCTADTCFNGSCVYEKELDANCADDGLGCTLEKCAPQNPNSDLTTGCRSIPKDEACEDNDPCTESFCDPDNGCTNQVNDCNDNLSCTNDFCNAQGCFNELQNGFCVIDVQDGQTQVPTCFAAGEASEENACDVCDPSNQTDVWTQTENQPCDDGDVCTIGTTCNAALGCQGGASGLCDDGSICTTDSCDPSLGCVAEPIVCDDGDDCTMDSCEEDFGCLFVAYTCNDDGPCTVSNCAPGSENIECEITKVADGTPCDDGVACTLDICFDGECVSQTDDDECADGQTCDLNQGCVGGCVEALDCIVSDFCKVPVCNDASDTCEESETTGTSGECTNIGCSFEHAQLLLTDSPGDFCVTEWCGWREAFTADCDASPQAAGCVEYAGLSACDGISGPGGEGGEGGPAKGDLASTSCTADEDCAADADADDCAIYTCGDTGSCEINYSASNVECDDGDACTKDSCDVNGSTEIGTCVNTYQCDDGIPCTNDSCTVDGCVNVPDNSNCDPGEVCDETSGCISDGSGGSQQCPAGYPCYPDQLGHCEYGECSVNGNCTVSNTTYGPECQSVGCAIETADLEYQLGSGECLDNWCSLYETYSFGPGSGEETKLAEICDGYEGSSANCSIQGPGDYCDTATLTSCEFGECDSDGNCTATSTAYTNNCETIGCTVEQATYEYGNFGGDCIDAWCQWANNPVNDPGSICGTSNPDGGSSSNPACEEFQEISQMCN